MLLVLGAPLATGAAGGVRISAIRVAVGQNSATVSWTTDQAASSTVIFGETGDYELGPADAPALTTSHVVRLDGLRAGTRYRLRVVSSTPDGETAHSEEVTFVTQGPSNTRPDSTATPPLTMPGGAGLATGPAIDVWYGDVQTFGQRGNQQRYINILGRISSPNGFTFPQSIPNPLSPCPPDWPLRYSLNGGPEYCAGVGPNHGHPKGRRLYAAGDFNLDLDQRGSQRPKPVIGDNQVRITATDNAGQTVSRTVTVRYQPIALPLPYRLRWSDLSSIDQGATVVDGRWEIADGRLRIREMGYDRVVALGDQSWQDYEITVPITIHQFNPEGFASPSNGQGVGVVLRWIGHANWDDSQPEWGYYPIGAIGWYNWEPSTRRYHLSIFWGNKELAGDTSGRTLTLGTTYIFKMRVDSRPNETSLYRLKVWQQGTPEPEAWDLQTNGPAEELKTGSALLLAHQTDASFGDVTVTGTSRMYLPAIRN
jgi:hypothetical protein